MSPNEVFEDILAHFKSSTFDPLSTLRIRYDGQPAADTGGVLHQCFSDAFQRFSEKWFTETGSLPQRHLFSDATSYYQRYLCVLAE